MDIVGELCVKLLEPGNDGINLQGLDILCGWTHPNQFPNFPVKGKEHKFNMCYLKSSFKIYFEASLFSPDKK